MARRNRPDNNKRNFRNAIKEAARDSNLSFGQRIKLSFVLSIPAYRRELEDRLLKQAVRLELVPAVTTMDDTIPENVDWDNIIDFIIEWLPIILRIMALFMVF